MNKENPFDYFEDDLNPSRSNHNKNKQDSHEDDSQLAFFKPLKNNDEALEPINNQKNNTRYGQFGQQASRLNQQRYNNSPNNRQHSFSPVEALSIDDMYIYAAQIDVVSNDLLDLVNQMPVKFENFILNFSKLEDYNQDQELFAEQIKDLKQMCDKATLREKDLYEILNRVDNQGLRFKSIDVEQLKTLLDDAKNSLAKMPAMNVIQNNPLLSSEYEQLEGRINALNKEILRRTIYEKSSSTHHTIRPLRSLKSAIYYINRFIVHEQPKEFLHKAVRMLTRLRELANFIINPEHDLNEVQIQQIIEVIKQGSHEWDKEFLDNGSSVWDFGPFDIKKIPLLVVAPAHSDNYGGEEEISLSVIPDYLIHQVRILLNNLGLRKKPQFFHQRNNRYDNGN